MKISKEQLKQLVTEAIKAELQEQAIEYKDVIPGADGEFYKYAQKVDKFLNDTIEEAAKLHEEGQELVQLDILGGHDSSVKAAERNRYITERVGLMHKLKGILVGAYENLRREA